MEGGQPPGPSCLLCLPAALAPHFSQTWKITLHKKHRERLLLREPFGCLHTMGPCGLNSPHHTLGGFKENSRAWAKRVELLFILQQSGHLIPGAWGGDRRPAEPTKQEGGSSLRPGAASRLPTFLLGPPGNAPARAALRPAGE